MYVGSEVDLSKIQEIEITYSNPVKPSQRPQITNSTDCAKIFHKQGPMMMHIENKELFYAMYLNRTNRVIGIKQISSGSATGTVADPQEILEAAVKAKAHGIIVCHNHPSGNIQPSESDKHMTLKLKNAAKFFDKELLDHIILGDDGKYLSMADEGII